jgi:hypothetical protein
MPAGPYCYNTDEQGVISIPYGHPLQQFIGTQYEDVLMEYLGESSVYASGSACTLHTSWQESDEVTYTLIPNALILLNAAQQQLAAMDVYSWEYSNLQSAITNLQGVINQGSPSAWEVESAMSRLTQAMTGY